MTLDARRRDLLFVGDDGSDPRQPARKKLRQVAVVVATAQVLERRADRCANPALAELLRERACERRHRAEQFSPGPGTPRPET